MVKKQLKTSHNLLLAAGHERHNLTGTEKTMPVDEPDYVAVALRQLDGRNEGKALEAGKTRFHYATMTRMAKMWETAELVLRGKFSHCITDFNKCKDGQIRHLFQL